MKFESNPPEAASLMMSARSFGNYDLPGAIADLIDNSIKARASRIIIRCLFREGDPLVSLADDGEGMSKAELSAAMRPASTNPTAERSPDDLGRFGWGMKSASFSQCRKLTVITRRDGATAGAAWDLDHIDGWQMAVLDEAEATGAASDLRGLPSGTEVIWSNCDRLSENRTLSEEAFNDLVAYTRSRLELTFHKFLSGLDGAPRLQIEVNGIPLEAYDPFYRSHPATTPLEKEDLHLDGELIRIRPFVLPHYSKLRLAEHDRLGGEDGFLKTQGFYVYRNNRLIIHGTWFRLAKYGELSQLVRISIDIPNSLDDVWKITVDKSDAQLPAALRNRLSQIVAKLRGHAARVYRGKGGRLDRPGAVPVWSRHVRNGEVRYSVNRDHPLVAAALKADEAGAVESMLRMIEQGFPVSSFAEDATIRLPAIHQTEADPRRFLEDADRMAVSILERVGTLPAMISEMSQCEPFASNWALVRDHFRERGWPVD